MHPEQLARLPEVLFEIGKAIGSSESPEHMFAQISEMVCGLLDADACSVILLDASGTMLLGKAAYGLAQNRINEVSFRVGEGVAGWVVEKGEVARIDDVDTDPRYVLHPDSHTQIRSMACVPIVARSDRVGALTVTSAHRNAFSTEEAELLSFIAKTIALDLENIRLRKVAVTDPLTGAFNREFLQHQLPVEFSRATDQRRPISVCMVDVDHFKAVNDKYGHNGGDIVLAAVTDCLRHAIRTGDFVVRYGGEEFLIVLPGSDLIHASEVGERIRANIEALTIDLGDKGTAAVCVSVGVSERQQGEPANSVIQRADEYLYKAKANGRNRVEVAPSL